MTKYNNALLLKQAYPEVDFSVTNFFPLIGEEVTLTNNSTSVDSLEWTLNSGTEVTKVYSGDTVNLTVTDIDKLEQTLSVSNSVGVETLTKSLYGLAQPTEAYYEFTLNTQVARVDEIITIQLVNKFDYSDPHTVEYFVYDYSGDTIHSNTLTGSTDTFSIDYTGIYDIEVIATSVGSPIHFKKGMILTITPKLADINDAFIHDFKPTDECISFYGVPYSKVDGENYNFTGQVIESGTTIVIRKNDLYDSDDIYRLRLENLNGTEENPIIVTFDTTEQFEIGFESYWGIFLGNCKHVIIDGRGYNNLEYGLSIFKNPRTDTTATAAIQGSNLTTNTEFFGIEIHDIDFTGIFYKTDPKAYDNSAWRENFCAYDLKIHNNYIHNTLGEGCYLGYFNQDVLTGVDNDGITQTYRAHLLMDTKIYRNIYYRCGWDSLQLNNSSGDTVIAYNTLIDSAWYGEPDQNTGMSLGMTGKIHNNVMIGGSGLGIQVGPTGRLDIYNNLITDFGEGSHTLYLLGSTGVPEQNPNNSLENDIPINIYNNNLICVGRGNILSAQNVVQYKGVIFSNNVMKYITTMFGGQHSTTTDIWTSNISNNIRLEDIYNNEYKIASQQDNDYNIYTDSTLASGGLVIDPMYDIRGYKNWNNSDKFIGVYAGIIKISDSILNISQVSINSDEQQTNDRNVVITLSYNGTPTHYMLSESPLFTDLEWLNMSGNTGSTIPFTMSVNDGTKYIYAKIKNDFVESNVESGSIYYTESLRFLISLNPSTNVYDTPSPWVNLNASNSSGVTYSGTTQKNLLDQYSDSSHLYSYISSGFDDTSSNAYDTETYPYTYKSVRHNWVITKDDSLTDIGTITISGCSDQKLYDVLLYSNKKYGGGEQIYSVNGVEQIYNNDYSNIQNISTFNNVVPVLGEITISLKCYSLSSDDANLGVIDITEHDNNPILNDFEINSGQTNTNNQEVEIYATTTSSPTDYMISENSGFTGSVWQTYNNDVILYTFNTSTIETKYIYLKFKNIYGESQSLVKTIIYDGPILTLDSIDINLGSDITTSPDILIDVTYHDGTPTDYRFSDNIDTLSGVSWITWVGGSISYTLPSIGSYTLYLELKDSGTTTDIASDTIDYITPTTTTTSTTLTPTTTTTTTDMVISGDKSYLIDLGVEVNSYYETIPYDGQYWNNFMPNAYGLTKLTSGITLSNLLDSDSGISNLNITFESDTWSSYSTGGPNEVATGATIFGYDVPASALRDTFVSYSGQTGTSIITGCDDAKKYKIGVLSSKYGVPDIDVTINGTLQSIHPPGNYSMTIWDNIEPVSGEITIEVYSPTHYAYFNVIEIVEKELEP